MLFKITECLSTSLVAHKEGCFSLFRLLFRAVSGSLQSFLVCYGLQWGVVLYTRFQESNSCRFYYKARQVILQSEAAFFRYKPGQVISENWVVEQILEVARFLLHYGAGITKQCNFTSKQADQLLQCWLVKKENERNSRRHQILATHSLLLDSPLICWRETICRQESELLFESKNPSRRQSPPRKYRRDLKA